MAKQCGVSKGTIRLPEDSDFDVTSLEHLKTVADRFMSHGIKPIIIEPLPNELHDHIKLGDEYRDECIEKFIKLMANLREVGIGTVCCNFMAHYGWTRTGSDYPERGGAMVTAFDNSDFVPTDAKITADELWKNYGYFVKAVVPHAEKHGIKLALHPDDPPIPRLGDVERIMINEKNIHKAVFDICPSKNLGITLCQANYHIMGENLTDIAEKYKEKIFFIHFRNTVGNIDSFRETFHDNGNIKMAETLKMYVEKGIDVPIRVDHVPTLVGEKSNFAGYDALGRLFAIGYLKGILEAVKAY